MPEYQISKKSRKGTKSCTECRRRKIRCIRSSEDAQTCRSCEDRGTTCIAQLYSSRPLHAQRFPSRYRISQLESEVASLRKVVYDIRTKLGYQPTETPEPTVAQPGSNPGTGESDDDSSVSDVLAAEKPSHLRSLFQNDWLSVDSHQQDDQLLERKAKASVPLLDMARHALQKLIPSKEEVSEISGSASKWLVLLHALLPQPIAVKSWQDILESYEDMHKPDVDTISLASWLLDVAVIAQQVPQEHSSPSTKLRRCQRGSGFSRAVSDTVEKTILSHDRLIGTVQGLGLAMHFLRFQMSQGNFQRAWVRLRHIIAIAELVALPKASQVQLDKADGVGDDESQLWDLICSTDRLLGIIINLPPVTKRTQITNARALAIDGVVQTRIYLSRLTEIATKIQYLDDMNTTQEPAAKIYASALELDRELRTLASQTPKSWWDEDVANVKADHIVQSLHYYISMRVHLPFIMRKDSGEEYIYSRLACIDACEWVAQRYQSLRRVLPSGIFFTRILDLQAFTATIVLLLTSHCCASMNWMYLRTNKVAIEDVVEKVIKLMDEKSHDAIGSDFAQRGVVTIRSLYALLRQTGNASTVHQLTLNVPLLGKVHIQSNIDPSQAPKDNTAPSSQVLSRTGLGKPNEQYASHQNGSSILNADHTLLAPTLQTQAEWQWNPLSWSIEDNHDNFYQDILMENEFEQFAEWQAGYNNF